MTEHVRKEMRKTRIGGGAIVCKIIWRHDDGRRRLIIAVEVDSAAGLPAFDIVGLPDTAVRESKERVRTAIRNSGIQLRQEKVTINLAPAGIRKDSPGLDLPIAVGLLAAYGVVPADCSRLRSLRRNSRSRVSAVRCAASCRWSSPRVRRD